MESRRNTAAALLILVALCSAWTAAAPGMDQVTLRRDGKMIHVEGRVLVTAQDGGLLVLARDGVLWAVPPEEQVKQTSDEVPFKPFNTEEMTRRLLDELPPGFQVHKTPHYLICYNTSRGYAQWVGGLFEQLHRVFTNYWQRKGFPFPDPRSSGPEFPLVAIVFADQDSFVKHSRPELGDAAPSIIGYFSLRTNWMTMYDLTGIESLKRLGRRNTTSAQINQILSSPEATRQVATIIHEATHQIAFNNGLHTRYSDCPVWFSEGIAIYFETPNLRSSKGWRGVTGKNQWRLARFRRYMKGRPADSLRTLLVDDKRFRDLKQSLDAYAEAWALTYYLIRRQPDRYVDYLKMLSQKKPLMHDDAETRVKEFEEAFGDLDRLDAEFLRYMAHAR